MIYFKKQIQEEIDYIEFQIKHLGDPQIIREDIKDENPIVEAFQKDRIKKKIELYKEAKKLFEEAIKLEGNPVTYKERNNLIREAMIANLNADIMEIFYNKKDVDLKEEFETFKNDFK